MGYGIGGLGWPPGGPHLGVILGADPRGTPGRGVTRSAQNANPSSAQNANPSGDLAGTPPQKGPSGAILGPHLGPLMARREQP